MAWTHVGTGTVTNTTTDAPSFALPGAGETTDDVLELELRISASTATVTSGPAGWTLLPNFPQSNGGNGSLYIYRKIHDGSESNPQATLSASTVVYGAVSAYRPPDTTTPEDATPQGAFSGTSTDPVVPAVTSVTDGALSVIHAGSQSGAPTYTVPAGYTDVWSIGSPEALSAYQEIATAGAIGPVTVVSSGDRAWIAGHVVFRPASGGGGVAHEGAAVINAVSTVAAAAAVAHNAAGAVAGVSSLASAATAGHTAAGAVAAASSVTTAGTLATSGSASVVSTSVVSVAATAGHQAAAQIDGTSTISAAATTGGGTAHTASATIAAVSSVTVGASAGHAGSAAVAGASSVAARGTMGANGAAVIAGAGSVTVLARVDWAAMATIAAVSSVTVSAAGGAEISIPLRFYATAVSTARGTSGVGTVRSISDV